MPRPDPASSLGNPTPPFAATLDLPALPPEREGRVARFAEGWTGAPLADLAAARKILVVALDFIGDWVLTTPFLRGLRQSARDAEITAIVLHRTYALAEPCRLVDRVISAEPAEAGPLRFAAATEEALAGFLADYGSDAFDLALVPRWDTDFNGATRVAGLSGARQVLGFSETCTERRREDNRGFDRFYSGVLVDDRTVHEADRALALLTAIGGAVADRAPVLDLTDTDHAAAEAFIRASFGEAPILAVAPFAAGRKQWPVERSATVARALAGRYGLAVAVIGSPVHAAAADAFAAAVGGNAASAAGRLGLREAAALIGRASLLFGMDSSPGHIAAALGVPAAVMFSAAEGTSALNLGAPERFRPLAPPERLHVMRPAAPLPPCTDGCDADEPHCITAVTVEDVLPGLGAFAERAVAIRPTEARRSSDRSSRSGRG